MADVPFNDVANLPYKTPTESISYGPDPLQTAEYWNTASGDGDATSSSTTSAKAPLVLLIHGGCWLNTYNKDHIRPLATALVASGLAVFSVEYRRVGDPGGGWPGTFDDLSCALDTALKLNHSATIAVGHSAGGHLALWLAARSDTQLTGVIGLAAISDLVLYAKGTSDCEKATLQLMGGSPELYPDRYRAASPLLMASTAPTLLLHGSHDKVVNIQQSTQLVERLAKQSTQQSVRHSVGHSVKHSIKPQPQARLHVLAGSGHFDLIDPRQAVPDIIADQIQLWLK